MKKNQPNKQQKTPIYMQRKIHKLLQDMKNHFRNTIHLHLKKLF